MDKEFFLKSAILFAILLFNSSYADESKTKDDFEINFNNIEVKKGADILAVDLEVIKTAPTIFKVNGFVEHFKQFNDEWTMTLRGYILENGTPRNIMTFPLRGICSFLKHQYRILFYKKLKEHSNAPHYNTCPLMPAKYVIKDYPIDGRMFEKFFNEGSFLFTLSVSHSENELIQVDITFSCVKAVTA